MKNTEKTEMTFDKKNLVAIQNAMNVGENNGTATEGTLTDLVNTGNTELDSLTVRLMTLDAMGDRIKAYKAVTLNYIKKNFARLGAKTGCKDIIEYGKKFLNYGKSEINYLIQIAEKYIAIDTKNDTLPALTDFKYNVVKDVDGYTMKIGQLQEIISVDREKVIEALASGAIDSTSTQKELREWKKAVNNTIETTATDSNTDGNTDNTDGNTDDNTDGNTEATKLITDDDRLNAILNIVNSIEFEEARDALSKAVEKARKNIKDKTK